MFSKYVHDLQENERGKKLTFLKESVSMNCPIFAVILSFGFATAEKAELYSATDYWDSNWDGKTFKSSLIRRRQREQNWTLKLKYLNILGR